MLKQADDLKKGMNDATSGDGLAKVAKQAKQTADSIRGTGTEAQKSSKSLSEMAKSMVAAGKAKVGNGIEKVRSSAEKVKSSLSAIKNIKLTNVVRGLDVGLGKAVTGAIKLASGLRKVAAVTFKGVITGLGKIAQLGAKAAVAVGKIALKGMATGGAAVGTLVGGAVKSFADYEQLTGGVETLFKDSAPQVMKYANEAYKTAGLSANEYMDTVTSFSASLIQSTGGDAAKATDLANTAITDMADNANKMGTSMGEIQNAYQGFAKGNYTMLDNLKLGYGGTQEEMKRLIKDAAKLDSSIDANSMSYGNVVKAIHAVQDNMGITGTTALEAEKTISGSLATMKAAWGNMLTSLVSGGEDFDQNVKNLVSSVKTFAGNIMPVIQSALFGVTSLITELAPMIGSALPALVTTLLPQLMTAGMALINALISGVKDNVGNISAAATQVITGLISFLLQSVPQIILTGMQLLIGLAQGIALALPELIPEGARAIGQFVIGVVQMIPSLITAGLQLIAGLAQGIMASLPILMNYGMRALIMFVNGIVASLPQIIQTGVQLIVMFVQSIAQNLPQLLIMGVQLIIAIGNGILQAIPMIISAIPELFMGIGEAIFSVDWIGIGKKIITMLGDAILNGLDIIKDKIGGFFSGIVDFFTGGDGEAEAEAAGKELAESISRGIDSGKPSVLASAESTKETAQKAFTFDNSVLSMQGMDATTSLANGIAAGTGTVTGAATSLVDMTAMSFTMPDMTTYGADAATSMAGGITANTDTAVGAAASMASQVENAAATEVDVKINADTKSLKAFQSAIDSFATKAAAGIQAVPRAFTTAFTTVSAVVKSHMNAAQTATQEGLQQMQGDTTDTLQALVVAMASSCVQMVSLAQSCVASISSAFANANLYASGLNMMNGLINGMNAMRGAVMATAASIASAASQSINQALKIHSPSRVTMEAGQYTAQGFIAGLQNMQSRVSQASEDFAVISARNMQPTPHYAPSTSAVSSVTNSNSRNTTTYAPQFILNLNGASASDTNKRKIQRWVKESINEAFESMGRTNPKTVYV